MLGLCVCVCVCKEGHEVCVGLGGAEQSPTGGDEQAAANQIAHTHGANDDWRRGGKGRALS